MENIKHIDVLIIGAGPAGSVCGSLLKQAGVECLIVDQATFPRDKVCGGGLTVKAWRLLDMLLPGIQYNYRPITRMRCQFENDAVCEFQAEYPIRMTRRKDFDYSLLQYYLDHGGELMKGSFARFDQQADGQVLVTLKSGEQISCRYLPMVLTVRFVSRFMAIPSCGPCSSSSSTKVRRAMMCLYTSQTTIVPAYSISSRV